MSTQTWIVIVLVVACLAIFGIQQYAAWREKKRNEAKSGGGPIGDE